MPTPDEYGAKVHQASGMVSVQAACTLEAALELMVERARVSAQSVDDVADAVLERRIRFG
jgi:hypothetical protein